MQSVSNAYACQRRLGVNLRHSYESSISPIGKAPHQQLTRPHLRFLPALGCYLISTAARAEAGGAGRLFLKPLGPPSLGFDRETVRPVRQATHDLLKLLDDTEIFRDLRNHLVVYAEHNWIAGSLKVQHGIGEQIAADRLYGILTPFTSIGLLPFPFVRDAVNAREGDGPPPPEAGFSQLVSRARIGEKPAGRQPQMEPRAVLDKTETAIRRIDPVSGILNCRIAACCSSSQSRTISGLDAR